MGFEDLTEQFQTKMPELRGRLSANKLMSDLTWFRVGGPAQMFFSPADEADLSYFMKHRPKDLPVTIVGLGSNLLVRDEGVKGIVIRLGRGFNKIEIEDNCTIRVGTGVPDVKVARAAAENGIAGFSFYRGIPGGIGGALRMNGGAHGTETADNLVEVRGVDGDGNIKVLSKDEMGYAYRHCSVPADFIFTEALYQGRPGEKQEILKAMQEVAEYREENQPIKERTGGSTFKNPEGHSAWKLIDKAGCRGLKVGGAQMSEKHCNFMINTGDATAKDLETLGELVRKRVKADSGIALHWEIKRLGEGVLKGEALVADMS